MNKKPLPIGIDNFEKLIAREYYFVDKTLLIKDLLDNKADVNLFTRPRRFGKTLNMSMLQYYFEDRRDEFTEQIKLYDMTRMFNAIVNKNPEVFEVELNNLLLDTISFNDAYENFYYGFLAGVLSNMKGYIVKSNREGGTGRSDLFIKSVSRRGIDIVIEFKIANDIDDLEKKADEAIEQIEDRKYEMELRSEGYKNIFKYGIAFYKKDCLIKIKD